METLEHFSECQDVRLHVWSCDENIVCVGEAVVNSMKNLVDKSLECVPSVSESERLANKFK